MIDLHRQRPAAGPLGSGEPAAAGPLPRPMKLMLYLDEDSNEYLCFDVSTTSKEEEAMRFLFETFRRQGYYRDLEEHQTRIESIEAALASLRTTKIPRDYILARGMTSSFDVNAVINSLEISLSYYRAQTENARRYRRAVDGDGRALRELLLDRRQSSHTYAERWDDATLTTAEERRQKDEAQATNAFGWPELKAILGEIEGNEPDESDEE